MIEIGIVKERKDQGIVLVEFGHLGTQAECAVLQPTTGENTTYRMPSIGTQVVCWLESGKNIALGAVFSDDEPVPQEADPDGLHEQYGAMVLEVTGGKASLKNDTADLKTLLNDILTTIKNLTVSTSMGPSGTPLPPTIAAIEKCGQQLANLLK